MKSCLNLITLGPELGLDVQIKAAGEAGFQGVELWFDKIEEYLKKRQFSDLIELIESYDLAVASIIAVHSPLWSSQDEFDKQMKINEKRLDLAEKLDAECVVAILSDLDGHSVREAEEATYKRLREVVKLAEERNLKLGLEFIAFRRFVNNLESALKIVETIDNVHLGITFDTFHFFKSKGNPKEIGRIPKDKLFLVHINDVPEKPLDELQDSDRVYMGRGVIPLKRIIGEIRKIGYQGFLSVELFNREYWKQAPLKVAKTCLETLNQYMASEVS